MIIGGIGLADRAVRLVVVGVLADGLVEELDLARDGGLDRWLCFWRYSGSTSTSKLRFVDWGPWTSQRSQIVA